MVTFCTSNTWMYLQDCRKNLSQEEGSSWEEDLKGQSEKNLSSYFGSWSLLSEDGGESWVGPFPTPCNTPHGPVRLPDGKLVYLGRATPRQNFTNPIIWAKSSDGVSWGILKQLPAGEKIGNTNYFEPYLVSLPSGKLLGLIRVQSLEK